LIVKPVVAENVSLFFSLGAMLTERFSPLEIA
jgi:hypothetical protein